MGVHQRGGQRDEKGRREWVSDGQVAFSPESRKM